MNAYKAHVMNLQPAWTFRDRLVVIAERVLLVKENVVQV